MLQPIPFNYANVIRRWQEGSLTYEERMHLELLGRMGEEHANARGTSYLPPEFQEHPTIDNFIILGFTLLALNHPQKGEQTDNNHPPMNSAQMLLGGRQLSMGSPLY